MTYENSGEIISVRAMGGLLEIIVKNDDDGERQRLLGDNGATVRALIAMFGRHIVSGMNLDTDALVGQRISYGVDDLGLLQYINT